MWIKIRENTLIFFTGGILYGFTEILWRRKTHWSMIATGGFCFLVLFRLFGKIRKIRNFYKCVIGSMLITCVEFAVGCVVNLKLRLNVWDYSAMPFNILGQICPVYSILWGMLTFPVVLICDFISKRQMPEYANQNFSRKILP